MKIIVPVDGSELALDAVRYALHLQRAGLQANFVLATVQDPVYLCEVVLAPDAEVLQRVSGAVGSCALEGSKALFKEPCVPYERKIGSRDSAQTLIEIAGRHGCEAIILGARGMGALRSAQLGCVSQAVLHASKVPVTIVKHVAADFAH